MRQYSIRTILSSLLVCFLLASSIFGQDRLITLPSDFPQSDYTPFGYIDNPYHSAVMNRSGVIRSVPPLGFGFWARRLPWPYGEGAQRRVNYLSFAYLSVNVDGVSLHTAEDFAKNKVNLVSKYHTKTLMSYDWEFRRLSFSAGYFLRDENSLVCLLKIENTGDTPRTITLHATNIYGFPETRWWGSDGVAAAYRRDADTAISKIWAYGDVFALGSDKRSVSHKFTSSALQWNKWIAENDLSSTESSSVRFPGQMYSVESYRIHLAPGQTDSMLICLERGVSESSTVCAPQTVLRTAAANLKKQLASDEEFYRNVPLPVGDWSDVWKRGWVYDYETLRMTIRRPLGIYRHPWDGMQIFTPRLVLGETMLDTMCLSYADMALAKEVIYGTFADAPAPNVPCTREDGSMNMICADGSEVGTAPTWGYPFHMIRSIYLRDHDDAWIKMLYPHLKAFLQWWLKNRTDRDGWFHSKCDWESGQDGSKRFLIAANNEGAVADFVRTVDIEAAMAEAMNNMALFAQVAGWSEDRQYWQNMARHRIETTRAMYVDGWFRDFDARTNRPIILKDYYDVMMLAPLTVGIATPEQIEGVKPKFQYFREHPAHWLEWPSFMFPFAEAAWNVGMREFIAQVIADTADRVYSRSDGRHLRPTGSASSTLPPEYNYRIPGVAGEYWPLGEDEPGGSENYGWGATLPTLVIRNIIGFREVDDADRNEFVLAPAIPSRMATAGRTYGMTNLQFRGASMLVNYRMVNNRQIVISIACRAKSPKSITVKGERGRTVAKTDAAAGQTIIKFEGLNGGVYTVALR